MHSLHRRLSLLVLAALVVVAAACSGGGQAASTDTTDPTGTTLAALAPGTPCQPVADTGTTVDGEPEVTVPAATVTDVTKTDLVAGDGDPVVSGDAVTVNVVGVLCSTGQKFASTWANGSPTSVTLADDGLSKAIEGMKVGGRRLVVGPAEALLDGPPPQGSGIAPGETLVLVLQVEGRIESAAGKPCVAATDIPPADGKPDVPMPVGEVPSQLETTDLVVGSGAEVQAGAKATVNYVGVACSTGKQFDSSWDRAQPVQVDLAGNIIPGWSQGLVGMKVGGTRLLVIPGNLAYGSSGNLSAGIAPDEALVFVIQLVSIDG